MRVHKPLNAPVLEWRRSSSSPLVYGFPTHYSYISQKSDQRQALEKASRKSYGSFHDAKKGIIRGNAR